MSYYIGRNHRCDPSCPHIDIHTQVDKTRALPHTLLTEDALWSGPNPGTLWLCICYAAVNKCSCESHGLNNQSFPQCVNPLASGSKMVNCCNWSHPSPLLTQCNTLYPSLSVFLSQTCTHIHPQITHARAQARRPTVWGAAATFTSLNVIPGLNASLRV